MNARHTVKSAVLLAVLWTALVINAIGAEPPALAPVPPPVPPMTKSPVDIFRELLLMPPAARIQALTNRPPEVQQRVPVKLREYAAGLRADYGKGASVDELRERKGAMLEQVYRMLAIHLGEPPAEFMWQWRDKDNVFHRDGVLTPAEFMARHIKTDLDSMVCLIHCPQATKRFGAAYTVDYLGNVMSYSAPGANTMVAAILDIEALRQFRTMNLNSN